jgi:Tfp pilus assembly protein PilP
MKLRIGTLLLLAVMASAARAQNPDVIDNTRNTLQNLATKQTNDQNAALATAGQSQAPAASPEGAVAAPASSQPLPASQAPASSQPLPASQAPASSQPLPASQAPATPATKPVVRQTGAAPKLAHPKKKLVTPVVATKPAAAPKPSPAAKPAVAVEDKKNPEESKKKEPKEYSAAGRRDPFVSPVVSHISGGSGCNTGKRCLEIGQIMLTGIVKSENGMIAVVVNALNKAYFLRENDPVFNGYVVRITGDSVIFSETGQDQLGKPFTREVTKKITTRAA